MTGREFRDAGEVLAFLDGVRERNRQVVRRYERFAEQTGGLTGEGFSGDGDVRVTVDGDGEVTAVDIPDAALRHGGRLAGLILTAIREAQADRALKLARLGAELGAPPVDLVRQWIPEHVRDTVEQRGDHRG